jgi:uncharacterized protein (DUF952 family)
MRTRVLRDYDALCAQPQRPHARLQRELRAAIRPLLRFGRAAVCRALVDAALLDEALVWEPSRGGALFPHLYAPLPVAAVTASRPFAVAEDGAMRFEDAA